MDTKYEEMTINVLKEKCKKLGITTKNKKKAGLIEALKNHEKTKDETKGKKNEEVEDNKNQQIDEKALKMEQRRQRFGSSGDKIEERKLKYDVNERVKQRKLKYGRSKNNDFLTKEEEEKIEKRKHKYSIN